MSTIAGNSLKLSKCFAVVAAQFSMRTRLLRGLTVWLRALWIVAEASAIILLC